MTKFTPEQRAAIFDESRRILSGDERALPHDEPPAPTHEPPLVVETEADRWRREIAAAEQQRAAWRAELKHKEQTPPPDWARAPNLLDERIAHHVRAALQARWQHDTSALAEHNQKFDELARAAASFSDAVSDRLGELEKLINKLDATHAELRNLDRGRVIDMPSPLIHRRTN
jgi:DNA repair exonuclease SbcCD ATPase subunit